MCFKIHSNKINENGLLHDHEHKAVVTVHNTKIGQTILDLV